MLDQPRSGASATEPRTVHLLGNLITFLARGRDTDNRFSVVESKAAPGAGTPPHTQKDEECFYVIEGEFEFMLDGVVSTGGPGTFVRVAPGVAHAFSNTSGNVARMLIINAPGGTHESFFMEAGDYVADANSFPPMAAPDFARLAAAAERHGITFLPDRRD